jgi:hypothetical protein
VGFDGELGTAATVMDQAPEAILTIIAEYEAKSVENRQSLERNAKSNNDRHSRFRRARRKFQKQFHAHILACRRTVVV